MVNYCCVKGCRKNSRTDTKINFYSLPKEKKRQMKWLKACGRESLSDEKAKNSLRFCSRHFEPLFVKNRLLTATAVPTLFLNGSAEAQHIVHVNIICDNCKNQVVGFRYKCVTCKDYDICSSCEKKEAHSYHCMIRMPVPTKQKTIDELTNKVIIKIKENSDKQLMDFNNSDSSDNEPITKYASKNNIELSNTVKKRIQDEVIRVLNLEFDDEKAISDKTNESNEKEDIKAECGLDTCFEADDSIDEQFFGFLKRKKPNFVYVAEQQQQECDRNEYKNNVQQEQHNNILGENILELT